MSCSVLRTAPRSALLVVVPLITAATPAPATLPPPQSANLTSPSTSTPPSTSKAASGSVSLSALPALFGVEVTPSNSARTSRRPEDQIPVDWFLDSALLESDGYARAVQAYRSGRPVAVIRGSTQEPSVDTALQGVFGLASTAAIAVYRRTDAGTLQMFTVADLPADDRTRRRVAATFIASLAPVLRRQALASHDRAAGGRTTRQAPGSGSGQPATSGIESAALPILVSTVTEVSSSGNGASVTLTTEVIRDTGPSHDALVVTSKSAHNLKPHHNGLSGRALIVPGTYSYWQTLTTMDNAGTKPTQKQWAPSSSSATDINISEEFTTSTRYAFGLSREVSAGVTGKVPQAGAKTSATFDFAREHTSTRRLSFSVKDYAIAAGATKPAGSSSRTVWELPLASSIFHRADYFGRTPSAQRMTPSMHQVTAEGVTTWNVPGTFAGTVNVLAGGSISNRSFSGKRVESIPDPRPQPTATTLIRADSPYLTRETTVFIQSKAGNGGCLRDNGGVVGIGSCPDSSDPNWVNDLHAQWQLDTHGRYYNRGSKQCMQILTRGIAHGSGGEVITARCSLNRDQRWEWQADRIHSLHGDAYPNWRLHVSPGELINVRTTGRPEFQMFPINPFHALLHPWSTYPAKPDSTAFIPKLDNVGPSQPASPEVRALKAAVPQERWELVVLRQGLHR